MRPPLAHRAVSLLCVLLASSALAGDRVGASVSTVIVSEHPAQEAHSVSVLGQVATVLRFEQDCDAAKTRLLGWEGRFARPVVVDNFVLLMPLRDLAKDERVPLLVTLADGTEVPFLLEPPGEGHRAEQQVNVFKDPRSYNAVVSSLYASLGRERRLEEENERFRQEENSPDHALAALLASGAVKQTPFQRRRTWSFQDEDADVEISVFAGREKAAAVVTIKNHDSSRSWSLKQARLLTTPGGEERTVAVRSNFPSIPPGEKGRIAFVVDGTAFVGANTPTNLALEVFRHDGLRQALVVLDHRLARQ